MIKSLDSTKEGVTMIRSSFRPMVIAAFALWSLADSSGQARAGIKIGVSVIDHDDGAQVVKVDGRLAKKMGLHKGDVITTVNGQDVKSANHFASVLAKNNTIRIVFERNGEIHKAWATRKRVVQTKGGGKTETITIEDGGEGDEPDDD
jgi:S1-C subfamily serine protease